MVVAVVVAVVRRRAWRSRGDRGGEVWHENHQGGGRREVDFRRRPGCADDAVDALVDEGIAQRALSAVRREGGAEQRAPPERSSSSFFL